MKVLMTADTFGGVWNYTVELCRVLDEYGVSVHLATMGRFPDTYQEAQIRALRNVVLHPSGYRLEWMDTPWEEVERALVWLRSIAGAQKPDLLHFNNYGQVKEGWDYPVVVVAHSCVLSWWRAVNREEAPQEMWREYRERVRGALDIASVTVAPTRSFLEELDAVYGKRGRREVVHNGRRRPPGPGAVKEPFILSVGRIWDEAKNMGALVEAAPKLDWPVYIAGESNHPVTGKTATSGAARFLGALSGEELAGWMERASLYVQPGHYEPFGLSALEAALAKCPLALSGIPTFRELWGDCAAYFDQRDPGEMVSVINRLVRDPRARGNLAARAFEAALGYSAESMGSRYYGIYERLCGA